MRKLTSQQSQQTPDIRRHWRLFALMLFLFTLFFVVIGRLFMLQVASRDLYQSVAEEQQTVSRALPSDRGEIFLREGGGMYPIAVNRQYFLAYTVPSEIGDIDRMVDEIHRALDLDPVFLRDRFSKKNDPFEVLKHRLSEEEVDRIRSLSDKSGIYLLPEVYRYYPSDNLASQVLGFVGMKDDEYVGRYGIEAFYEKDLQGVSGIASGTRDASGRWITLTRRELTPPEHGDNLLLTIERVIQYEVEKILQESLKLFDADSGTIIVMDPKTGSILALASSPDFNPNEYSKVEDVKFFVNPAVSFTYEPGSIMKPITMAMGINEGKVNPQTEYIDTGVVQEAGYAIRNAEDKVYGRSNMITVLNESINTGMIFVERLVGNERFREYLEQFGFGSKTGIELPAEVGGNLRNLANTSARKSLEFYTASFGQGITVTPLQIVSAFSALANDGVRMKPRIVDRVFSTDGQSREIPPEEVASVISVESAKTIGTMLRDVVVNGHGKRADVPGYLVGGKTGTAQVAKSGEKGYEEGMNIGSFVGYAPLNDPRFVVLVKIDNPKTVTWAESSAAPTFGRVMKFLLKYARIEPTEEVKKIESNSE